MVNANSSTENKNDEAQDADISSVIEQSTSLSETPSEDLSETPSENNNEGKSNIFDKMTNSGKGFLNKWDGKGFIGAGAGLIASKLLFKSKSPIMMLVMTGGGFLAERFLVQRPEEKRYVNEVGPPIKIESDKTADVTTEFIIEDLSGKTADKKIESESKAMETDNLANALFSMSGGNTNRYQPSELNLTMADANNLQGEGYSVY